MQMTLNRKYLNSIISLENIAYTSRSLAFDSVWLIFMIPQFQEPSLILGSTAVAVGNALRWTVPHVPILHWFDTWAAVILFLLMCFFINNIVGLGVTLVCYLWVCLTPGFSQTRHHCFHYIGYCVLACHIGWTYYQLIVSASIYWIIVLMCPNSEVTYRGEKSTILIEEIDDNLKIE